MHAKIRWLEYTPSQRCPPDLGDAKRSPVNKRMRSPKFSLRFALIAIGIIGVAAALLTKQQRIAGQLRQHNVRIEYQYQYENWSDLNRYSFNGDAELSSIGTFVGPDLASTVVSVSSRNADNPAEIARLASKLPSLRRIAIQDTELRDDELERLSNLQELRVLHLRGTMLTDSSIRTLSLMNQLRVLNLRNTSLSQEAIEDLREALPNTRIHTGATSGGFM